jgi:hypothetical protein
MVRPKTTKASLKGSFRDVIGWAYFLSKKAFTSSFATISVLKV